MFRYILSVLIVFASLFGNAQGYREVPSDNDCSNPIILTDTVTNVKFTSQLEKAFFIFKADKEETLISLFPSENVFHCDYLVFRYNPKIFCDSVNAKKLLPLRNKVCDKGIDIDANTWLSEEAIRWGVCLCPKCCYLASPMRTTPGEYYCLVVYGGYTQMTIGLNSKKMQFMDNPELFEYDPFQNFKIEVGKSIKLDNILFKSNSDKIMPESYSILEKLAAFMRRNPTVTIEIQGHVNAPGEKPSLKLMKLSDSRAYAVYTYLVQSGIDGIRMTTKGYGNTRMINKNPRNDNEGKPNRRVEILITGK